MPRHRTKSCDRCLQPAQVLYRVQWNESGQWTFVCKTCHPSISQNNPTYTYGGTWKAVKANR